MTDLVFTSPQALKRSIKRKYPTLTDEQREATFLDQKEYIGQDVEAVLEKKYAEYKKSL